MATGLWDPILSLSADGLQSIQDVTRCDAKRGWAHGRKSDRLPRLSYKQKANQERIEGGQLKF